MTLMPLIFAAIMSVTCHGWISTTNLVPLKSHIPPTSNTHNLQLKGSLLEEPDNQFGRMTYWDESYRESLVQNDDHDGSKNDTETFSWYCGWNDELEPFFNEVVPLEQNPTVLIPGIGNDACIRDMFDSGYHRLSAFDYAPEGVECAKRMFGPQRLQLMDDLLVADARDLPYDDASFDAVLDKGTLDSIFLSGGKDKVLARKHLGMAVSELARVVKVGGVVFSVTAACVDAVQQSFDEYNELKGCCWKQIRDGSLYITEDGYTSNNVDATMLVWERIK
mmetsp:Transcript_11956/g.22155  ORF Transcript_11956/g.22155 Transcript_11956/m.22155 type:complete len:278 (+) Transcript_11956:209-1042(+)